MKCFEASYHLKLEQEEFYAVQTHNVYEYFMRFFIIEKL